jgi:hypothetical protein
VDNQSEINEAEVLPYPDLRALNAAEGWLMLGNPSEAKKEIANISNQFREETSVLLVRWKVHFIAEEWASALKVSRRLCHVAPSRPEGWVCKAYCFSQRAKTLQAKRILLRVTKRFPSEPVIFYNLACYACQLGQISEAFEWFLRALRIENSRSLLLEALDDPDLTPLRQKLQRLLPASRQPRLAMFRPRKKKGCSKKG